MKQIDLKSFTLDDVVAILHQTGYNDDKSVFRWAESNEFFKYIGVSNHTARYLVGFEDDENEDMMYVTIVHISIGSQGTLVADYNAMPVFTSMDIDAIAKYIEYRCN